MKVGGDHGEGDGVAAVGVVKLHVAREVGIVDSITQAVGQQHNNNTPANYVLEVRRAVAQLLLVSRAGRELLHLSTWFPNPSTERDGSS